MKIGIFILFICLSNSAQGTMLEAIEALHEIKPGAEWSLTGDNYEGLDWKDPIQNKPTKKQFDNAVKAVQNKKDEKEIRKKRKREYPPIQEQIEMILKGEETELRNKLKAVDDKYPLP